ncbi:hypothetical protein [Pantoea ananatis]|uniref:hypothetical protein n=1 Tax=Pantoea ananas TaxID=553 RepID=UPI000313EDF0|nr:hypothetical protein [Pantoea ananatis]BBL31769.1 hypothetical protein PAFU01_32170 [Pantoea ananatis]
MWRLITLILMTLLLATSCSSPNITNPEPIIYRDSACILFSPIYTHGDDANKADIRTVRAINSHNDLWDVLCGHSAAEDSLTF